MNRYPRDMIGYGAQPPFADWPNNAKIAVQFVLNYEEGGENCILHGDGQSEAFYLKLLALIHGLINATGIWNPSMNMALRQGSGDFIGYLPNMISP